MTYVIRTLDDAREAVRAVAAERRTAMTALADAAGISRGIITRFVSKRSPHGVEDPDIRLRSLLTYLNYAEYELVVRKRDTRNMRERVLDDVRRGRRGDESAA